ncbi:LOW QUALITY PROTEIN: isobutyryl-CoA dehydrogenase, mitochondrial-like [Sergentomyia squamirostris]
MILRNIFRSAVVKSKIFKVNFQTSRCLSHYPIDENLYGLSNEQQLLRQTVFNFAEKELAPYAQEIDKEDNFRHLREFWKKAGNLGLLGILAPEEYGGSGGTYLDQCIVFEEMSRACGSISISYATHIALCMHQLLRFGNIEQKTKFLPQLCNGEHIGALAMSEPNAGSDIVSMKTRAEKKGDYYILNGSKFWITNALHAHTFIVYAKTNATGSAKHSITAFIVDKRFSGFRVGEKLDKLGLRGSGTAELIFEDCKVPEKNILGKEGKGVYVLMTGLDYERLLLSALPVGGMQAACDVAFDYAHQRKAFGQRIGEFQLIQAKMADMYTLLVASRCFLYNVVRSLDAGRINPKDCSALWLYTAENATKLALECIQILGGNGYINDDYPAGRFLRDVKAGEIGGGTTEIRRLVIGRAINSEYK